MTNTSVNFELINDHSVVVRSPEFYDTRLRRSKLELIQATAELDMIAEIPTWRKIGMFVFQGKKFHALKNDEGQLKRTREILRKRIEIASDLRDGDTTYHTEAGFDAHSIKHNLHYVDLTAVEDSEVAPEIQIEEVQLATSNN